jgi:hypothetical protein
LTGVELVVTALAAWSLAKARRAARRADGIVDDVIDTGLEKVHDIVLAKLGDDDAIAKLELEAATTAEVSARTRERAGVVLAEAVESDADFAAALAAAMSELRSSPEPAAGQSVSGTVRGSNIMIGGNVGGSVNITGGTTGPEGD